MLFDMCIVEISCIFCYSPLLTVSVFFSCLQQLVRQETWEAFIADMLFFAKVFISHCHFLVLLGSYDICKHDCWLSNCGSDVNT